ncbi:MAG: hypothetical protein EKK41_05995 [Hyphomicrobiales bacterium]|nr:MAG: hypothetical protein EKK41_05995 [Hyphomicrobiales bacterium]
MRHQNFAAAVVGIVAAMFLMSGCAADREPPRADVTSRKPAAKRVYSRKPVAPKPEPLAALDKGSCDTSDACVSKLKALLADKSRSWIGAPQTAADHIDGTRQFAYIALSKSLRCAELKAGIEDIATHAKLLDGKTGFAASLITATRAVNTQAREDLEKQMAARCPQ